MYKNMKLSTLNTKLNALALFRGLLKDPVMQGLMAFLAETGSTDEKISKYAQFVSLLYGQNFCSLAKYVENAVNDTENPYIKLVGQGIMPVGEMEEALWQELAVLQLVADLTPEDMCASLGCESYLPKFPVEKVDIIASYKERVDQIGKHGYGIYAKYHMFYINSNNQIVPVKNPDSVRLDSLVAYEREKKVIMDNTNALLEGRPAANILLTGDAGTGKSSTIKAVVNELYTKGLRILEVRKDQLREIPAILDELNTNPLKFILFIDDLSFQKDDDNFSALKAILEGSVSAKSSNVVIYATGNRRHLVKETFSDRDGDDIHRNDTMQEIISLSERFGIQLTFQKPNKQVYLEIVHDLAKRKGVTMDEAELDMLAERFAINRGGRSARAANQFVDTLL